VRHRNCLVGKTIQVGIVRGKVRVVQVMEKEGWKGRGHSETQICFRTEGGTLRVGKTLGECF